MGKTLFFRQKWLAGWTALRLLLTNMASLPSTSWGSGPSQQTYTAEQALQMIWDGDDNQDNLSSDDSSKHDGKESEDEEITDCVRQLLGQTAPAQSKSGDSDSSAERVSMDFEHSERLW